jgi:hypothetical protein
MGTQTEKLSKFTNGLVKLVKENLPAQLFETFRQNSPIEFPEAPLDYEKHQRKFKTWHMTADGSLAQGEVNSLGQFDGKNIVIDLKTSVLAVGFFRNGKCDGMCIDFYKNGNKASGECALGK